MTTTFDEIQNLSLSQKISLLFLILVKFKEK